MPEIPNRKRKEEELGDHESPALGGDTTPPEPPPRKKKRKRKSKPTGPKRNYRQKLREKYSSIREEAQLAGIIPTTPEGAIRSEVVDPASQETPTMPDLTKKAIRNGWAVPEDRKSDLVDEMVKIIDTPETQAKVKVAAFNALRMADQQQYERDNPGAAGKAKGGVSLNVAAAGVIQQNIEAKEAIRKMIEAGELGILEENKEVTNG